MAACSFGASSLKLTNLRLGSARIDLATASQRQLHAIKIPTSARFDGLLLSQVSGRALKGCLCLTAKNAQSGTDSKDCSDASKSSKSTTQLIPDDFEVEALLTQICDTTSIAEFELKIGGFRLYVMRDLAGESTSSPPMVSAPITNTTVEAAELNGSASSQSLAITKAAPSSGVIQAGPADEGLTIVRSPLVGCFQGFRMRKKRKLTTCKETDNVRKGQIVCYIKQLGVALPVRCGMAGKVIKIFHKDGDPVGYGDALMSILPRSK